MKPKTYFDRDADPAILNNKTIAIIGYGAQGRSFALNLRDSGCRVVVGQRPGGIGYANAVADGFDPQSIRTASATADIINILLPDECHGPIFREEILPGLNRGDVIMTCHGFSLHYQQVVPPPGVASVLVAPKAAGHRVRSAYAEGSGVPFLIALGPGGDAGTLAIGLAVARAMGGTRVGVLETTVAAETETDLFGEQAVLCGGVSHLIKAAFETLISAGYQEELAYYECLHELKLVVDLIHRGGLAFMHDHISNTAEFGDYTRGPRLITATVRTEMRKILDEVRDGRFAQELQSEFSTGQPTLTRCRLEESQSQIEQVGRRLRDQMGLS